MLWKTSLFAVSLRTRDQAGTTRQRDEIQAKIKVGIAHFRSGTVVSKAKYTKILRNGATWRGEPTRSHAIIPRGLTSKARD
ncbi:hypothetical protein NITHO_1820002 [Nitrolancea hollandica Lb]|uniref:Uncharacterized protein n=1 Tax=Nitrolancea hollandica Lb TaxID=1129897 RepID=I4EEF6_9BACT|nr:hypothetical protein NITHO_1820002 [Nitrolancea hollandica Lb]